MTEQTLRKAKVVRLSTGQFVGALLFVQLVGLIVPFILLMPITTSGYLENASGIALQIKVAVFHLFANGVITVGIAVTAFPVIRNFSIHAAIWFLAVSLVWFTMQAVDNAHIMSMLSLSQQFADPGTANPDILQTIGAAARSTRKWIHYTELLVVDLWFLVFYGLLFRFTLIPRFLAAFGVTAVIIHATAIPLPMFMGYASVMPMLGASLALSHLAVGIWLIVKGFAEPPIQSLESTA